MTAEQVRESEPSTVRWGMPDAAICFFASLVTSQVAAGLWLSATGDRDSLGLIGAGFVGLWVGLLVPMHLMCRAKGSGSFVTDFGLRFERARDLVGIPIGVAIQVIAVPLLYLPLSLLIRDLYDRLAAPAEDLSDTADGTAAVVLLAVIVVVGAPIVEELFYRGLLLRSVQNRFGPVWAVVVSSVVFGAAHLQPLQFPALVGLGVVLGTLAVRTGRLGPSIFAHAGFNAVTMAVLIATR